jgi:DNA-binding LacI/PurR family transcriptional regulator
MKSPPRVCVWRARSVTGRTAQRYRFVPEERRPSAYCCPTSPIPCFHPFLRGIEEELRKAGYVALIADVENDEEQYDMVKQMLARQVDGLILATTTRRDPIIDFCMANSIPVVSVNRSEDNERTSSVVHDESVGMRIAVSHLASLGHRKIGHVAGPQHISTGFLRRRGFIDGDGPRRDCLEGI